MSRKINQSGFTAIEVSLIVVVVGLVGVVGWLVYDRASSKESVSSNSNDTSETVQTTKPAAADSYVEIKEWGVKIPLTKEYAGASYEMTTGPGIASAGAVGISLNGTEAGYFDRYKFGDTVYSPAGDNVGTFNDEYLQSERSQFYTKVDDYYYSFVGSQAALSDKDNGFRGYLAEARKNLEAL